MGGMPKVGGTGGDLITRGATGGAPGPGAPNGIGLGSGPIPGGPGAAPTATIQSDPTRSIYVVVPYTNDITKEYSFYKKAPIQSHNPHWRPAIKHTFGYANLIDDNTQTQLYLDLGPLSPKGVKTRQTELVDKH